MLAFAFRVALNALVLMYILPEISGITFHGEFWPQAVVAGLLFVVVAYVVRLLLGLFTIATFGVGAFIILFFLWAIPAMQLMLMAEWFPQYLSVEGWGAAVIGGLVFWVINMISRNYISQASGKSGD